MLSNSSSDHSLSSSSQTTRSLAGYAAQPLSPFSTQQLQANDALAPPSLLPPNRYAQQYPPVSGFAPEEPQVFRSVALDAAHESSSFHPLSSANFDHGDASHKELGSGLGMPSLMGSSKELGLGMPSLVASKKNELPMVPLGYATYQPSINFDAVQSDLAAARSAAAPAAAAAVASASQSVADSLPPAAPMWLEPHSHFFCECPPPSTPALLYDTVLATLQSLHEPVSEAQAICTLDCTPTPARYKLACTAYQRTSGAATPFIVRIFTADASTHKYCVEFQRRQGDCVRFFDLFRTARTRIQSAHPCASEVPPPEPMVKAKSEGDALNLASLDDALAIPQLSMRSWSAPALPASSGTFSKDHICSTVRSLLQMCASTCIDIKLEGVLALAELSCSPSFEDAMKNCSFSLHEVLVAEGAHQLFLDCLPDCLPLESADIHRASIMALANIVETQAHLAKDVLRNEAHLSRLYVLTESATHQVVREAARFLHACAQKLGPEMMRLVPSSHQHTFHATVHRLQNHQDAHCRKMASGIHEALRGAEPIHA